MNPEITVSINVSLPVHKVWELWTAPEHISKWNNINDDWHTPRVENDLREGGRFFFRMELKDGSAGFDHYGTYQKVTAHELIQYMTSDARKSRITFVEKDGQTMVSETFEPESETPIEKQREFCGAILMAFKKYAERER